MKKMTLKKSGDHTSMNTAISTISGALLLGLSLTLTACNNTSDKQSNTNHEHSQDHNHADHNHAEHDHSEHHNHETEHHEGHEHHDHAHGTGAKQVIPTGYTVNFAVSNHPLFLLSEAVTKGTNTTVKKLLDAGDVGHHGSLSPSDIKTIQDSKYVVWFGKGLESNLNETLADTYNAISLLNEVEIKKLPRRNENAEIITDSKDPHIWSDPQNAKIIVEKLAKLHTEANPEFTEQYNKNAQQFAKDIDTLVAKQKAKVGKQNQYWSSHDAFQYFENSLGIELSGTLTTDHEIPAKASQLVWLNKNRPYKKMCLITQSKPKTGVVNKLAPITSKVLIEDMSDSDSYLQAWEKESQKIVDCLAGI